MCVMYLQKWLLFLWALSQTDLVAGILPDDTTNLEDPQGELIENVTLQCNYKSKKFNIWGGSPPHILNFSS